MQYLTFKNVFLGLLVLAGVRYTVTEVIRTVKGDPDPLEQLNLKKDK